ncbi:poly [ADP-ribose] polymerase 2-A isoform X4 [Manihot esculenta]|uniref:poly [ADP-ribose] polymerase 2-A isoform X4 n=1 Tax=Manihot esculenta TaxID=3983 RepID=UPI001CC3D5C1|nr:poly [ADP-ribose] polymerase 2-A isoform X4 [Manihot esculenta]
MVNKFKADELGTELSRRGPSAAGTNPKKERLDSAHGKEKHSGVSAGKKRQRKLRVDDLDGIKKIKAIEDLHEQEILRSISSSGSKSELMASPCAVESNDLADAHDVREQNEAKETSKEEKQLTNKKKGSAVLDQHLPDHIKTQYHVLEQGDNIYDATLNQTNVGDNNNKFYVIQALVTAESNDGGKFMVYTRWGRVGIKGQDKLQGPYASREGAVQDFEAKFFSKTKNHWSNRKEFICHSKCYVLLEMDCEADQKSDVQEKPAIGSHLQASKLDPQIANFISLICNPDMMKQRMQQLGYNPERLPLGKLSRSTILKGYDVLRRISDTIDKSDREKLEELSGEFYTIIPHDFGFRKMRDFIIDTHYKLKCKLEMVEALGEIEIAASLFKDDIYSQADPLYSHYQCLRCELVPLKVGSAEFSMIDKYIHNTGDETHYRIDIVHLFKASREGEDERFKKFSNAKNRMLLWHGSQLTNWTGILSQGLRIAPPEAPSRGYSFGKGIYFADMFAKSVRYCGADWVNSDAVLILCEVALGDINEIQTFDHSPHQLPKGNLSAKAIGRTEPDPSKVEILEDGIIVPQGKPIDQTKPKAVWGMNEYIIFNVDQIRIRYVVHVKLCYNGVN